MRTGRENALIRRRWQRRDIQCRGDLFICLPGLPANSIQPVPDFFSFILFASSYLKSNNSAQISYFLFYLTRQLFFCLRNDVNSIWGYESKSGWMTLVDLKHSTLIKNSGRNFKSRGRKTKISLRFSQSQLKSILCQLFVVLLRVTFDKELEEHEHEDRQVGSLQVINFRYLTSVENDETM